MVTMAKKKAQAQQTQTPVEDLTPEIRALIEVGRKRGFVTHDDILEQFPDVEQNVDPVDKLYAVLAEELYTSVLRCEAVARGHRRSNGDADGRATGSRCLVNAH